MAKKVKAVVKLQLPAGKATPAPPVGPALGQHGVNIMAFIKQYNEQTASLAGSIIPVEITIYEDKSFSFVLKAPPASDLIRKALSLEKGSGTPGKEIIGTLSKEKLREIAALKMKDLNTKNIETAIRIIAGTAKSMGVAVEE